MPTNINYATVSTAIAGLFAWLFPSLTVRQRGLPRPCRRRRLPGDQGGSIRPNGRDGLRIRAHLLAVHHEPGRLRRRRTAPVHAADLRQPRRHHGRDGRHDRRGPAGLRQGLPGALGGAPQNWSVGGPNYFNGNAAGQGNVDVKGCIECAILGVHYGATLSTYTFADTPGAHTSEHSYWVTGVGYTP